MLTLNPETAGNNLTEADKRILRSAIDQPTQALLDKQHEDGHWCFELEADCTIPSEYIMMMHFLDEIDPVLEEKLATYIRVRQNEDGGWPLFYGGASEISCTVKAYFALKLAGENIEEPVMQKAREWILSEGGAARSNVFTRIALAMFEQIPWRGVPFIPVETLLLPQRFPFHIYKVSYWSRTVMVPLFILCSLKVKAKNPRNIDIQELFITPPEKEKHYFPVRSRLNRVILFTERIGFRLEPLIPRFIRRRAIRKAEKWFVERLNGTSGLGAIFPAMVNAYEALVFLGYPEDHPARKTAKEALEKLLVIKEDEAYCQPCVSPVWDTLLVSCALQELEEPHVKPHIDKALHWLISKQLLDGPGDWQLYQPYLRPGGWPFQYANDYYPDLDDTGFAAFALCRSNDDTFHYHIQRAAEWLVGMQSRNGGFSAFDADNTCFYLNEIPFADHGALLDPPTSDVTARVVMFLGNIIDQYPEYRAALDAALEFLYREQEEDGSWFGRWGTNYIYGTWSVLIALEAAGVPAYDQSVQKAVRWLKGVQNADGGWGEDNYSYHDPTTRGKAPNSTAFQTAWALLGLMAAGETDSVSVRMGINYLLYYQTSEGKWEEPEFTAPGFPRVFYLKYHGYHQFFPLWALSRYYREVGKGKIEETTYQVNI